MSSTKSILEPLSVYFEEASSCRNPNSGFGLWGSLSRDELTPFSDIDIICKQHSTLPELEPLSSSCFAKLSRWGAVDLAIISGSPLEFALTNGTKFHSIFFATNLAGNSAVIDELNQAQRALHANDILRTREIINTLGSQRRLALVLSSGDKRWAKCGPNGTNNFIRIIQAAQLRWPELVGLKSDAILSLLSSKYKVNSQSVVESWQACLAWRRHFEQIWPAIPLSALQFSLAVSFLELRQKLIQELMDWVQLHAGAPPNLIKNFCVHLSVECDVMMPEFESQEVTALLAAAVEANPDKLYEIMVLQGRNWWIASTLANNPNSPSNVLDMLAFPVWGVSIQDWQTVRLYVAGHPNTSRATLMKLIDTPGYRVQDYDAARNNLCRK